MSKQKRGGGEGDALFNGTVVQMMIWLAIFLGFMEAPLSFVYLYLRHERGADFLSVICTLEVAFFLNFIVTYVVQFRASASWDGPPTPKERRKTWERMLRTAETLVDGGLSAWIGSFYKSDGAYDWTTGTRLGAPVSLADMEDLEDLRIIVALFFFCKDAARSRQGEEYQCLSPGQKAEVDQMLEGLASRCREVARLLPHHSSDEGGRIAPTTVRRNRESTKEAPLRPRLNAFTKEAMWGWPPGVLLYGIVACLHLGFSLSYLRRGYVRRISGSMVYWRRKGSGERSDAPIVLLPGVGTGMLQYDLLLSLLEKDKRSDIFLVEMPTISMALLNWVPSRIGKLVGLANAGGTPLSPDAFIRDCERMLATECPAPDSARAVVVAHSYGSVYASLLMKRRPGLLRGCVLAEPAALLPHLNKTTRAWLYGFGPRPWEAPLSVLFRVEPHVSFTLRRHFDVTQSILFKEDITAPVRVFVTLGDTVMPAAELIEYARQQRGASNTTTKEDLLHVEPFVDSEAYEHGVWCHDTPQNEQMLQAIQQLLRTASSTKEE